MNTQNVITGNYIDLLPTVYMFCHHWVPWHYSLIHSDIRACSPIRILVVVTCLPVLLWPQTLLLQPATLILYPWSSTTCCDLNQRKNILPQCHVMCWLPLVAFDIGWCMYFWLLGWTRCSNTKIDPLWKELRPRWDDPARMQIGTCPVHSHACHI